jgi:hypothetical protein
VRRHAANLRGFFHHQHALADLGRLDRGAASRRPAADHHQIKFIHCLAPRDPVAVALPGARFSGDSAA